MRFLLLPAAQLLLKMSKSSFQNALAAAGLALLLAACGESGGAAEGNGQDTNTLVEDAAVANGQVTPAIEAAIAKQLSGMSAAWAANEKAKIADFYTDEAIMITPTKIAAQGREGITSYWDGPAEPTQWVLTSHVLTASLPDLQASEAWQALSENGRPPLPSKYELPLPEGPLFYQLGRSDLGTVLPDGRENVSQVTFLLIWQPTDEGFRIAVDSYQRYQGPAEG